MGPFIGAAFSLILTIVCLIASLVSHSHSQQSLMNGYDFLTMIAFLFTLLMCLVCAKPTQSQPRQ